jgi:hypothetical protein
MGESHGGVLWGGGPMGKAYGEVLGERSYGGVLGGGLLSESYGGVLRGGPPAAMKHTRRLRHPRNVGPHFPPSLPLSDLLKDCEVPG